MKKQILAVMIAIIGIMLASCAPQTAPLTEKTESPAADAEPSPVITHPIIKPSAPDATGEPAKEADSPKANVHTDTDIPDVVWGGNEYAMNSGHTMYEDNENIYFLQDVSEDKEPLYLISKDGKTVKVICEDCHAFTYLKGKVYYVPAEPHVITNDVVTEKAFQSIRCYDATTGRDKLIKKLNRNVFSLAIYREKIYYSRDAGTSHDDEPWGELYSMDINGKNSKFIVEYPDVFCFFKEKIYYTNSNLGSDGYPVWSTDMKSKKTNEVTDVLTYSFEVKDGKLFSSNGYGLNCRDLKTKKDSYLSFESYPDFATMGQYIVYAGTVAGGEKPGVYNDPNVIKQHIEAEEKGATEEPLRSDEDPKISQRVLMAYDIKTGSVYCLMDVTDFEYDGLYTAESNVYVSQTDENGSFKLFRLVISGGKASLELAAEVKAS